MTLHVAMRVCKCLYSILLFLLALPLLIVAVMYAFATTSAPFSDLPGVGLWLGCKYMVRKRLDLTHAFFPASHPHMHFVGRWMPTANQLRRDAAFPGSYIEMVITNTTSVHIMLNNWDYAYNASTDLLTSIEAQHSDLQPTGSKTKPSAKVSFIAELGNERIYGADNGFLAIVIATDLDPREKYKLKIIHMGGTNDSNGVMEFEGIWLDKPSTSSGNLQQTGSKAGSCLGKLLPYDQTLNGDTIKEPDQLHSKRKVVEIVTSEALIHKIKAQYEEGYFEDLAPSRARTWYNRLQLSSGIDTVVLPTLKTGLMHNEFNNPPITVKDLFFRAGPPETIHFPRPWSFETYSPSVLLLQLGLVDYTNFFSEKKNRNKHALEKFNNEFVDACITFVRTIRASAYPFDSSTRSGNVAMGLHEDGSYVYNSAPSTLPILLIAPFSASRFSVTTKLKLDRIISDALSQVAMNLQAHGDKSTFWVDTSGWLDPKADFRGAHYNSSTNPSNMNDFGNFKVASLLADHICPYLESNPSGAPRTTDNGSCAFDRYDNYLGNLYLPKDVEFDRAMLERKIETIKQKFNMEN